MKLRTLMDLLEFVVRDNPGVDPCKVDVLIYTTENNQTPLNVGLSKDMATLTIDTRDHFRNRDNETN